MTIVTFANRVIVFPCLCIRRSSIVHQYVVRATRNQEEETPSGDPKVVEQLSLSVFVRLFDCRRFAST